MGRREAPLDLSEPQLEYDDWTWWGGEPIFVVGFTAGGCPYGLTMTEYRDASERESPLAGWALAKRVLREVLGERGVEVSDREHSLCEEAPQDALPGVASTQQEEAEATPSQINNEIPLERVEMRSSFPKSLL